MNTSEEMTMEDIVADALYNCEVVTFGDAEDGTPGGQFVRISEAAPQAISAYEQALAWNGKVIVDIEKFQAAITREGLYGNAGHIMQVLNQVVEESK